nr:hypothetical protein Iba_scaffold32971CG0010 [Ipomoea batatas]
MSMHYQINDMHPLVIEYPNSANHVKTELWFHPTQGQASLAHTCQAEGPVSRHQEWEIRPSHSRVGDPFKRRFSIRIFILLESHSKSISLFLSVSGTPSSETKASAFCTRNFKERSSREGAGRAEPLKSAFRDGFHPISGIASSPLPPEFQVVSWDLINLLFNEGKFKLRHHLIFICSNLL